MNANLTLAYYDSMRLDDYTLSERSIRRHIAQMLRNDTDSMTADYRTRSYYYQQKPLLWISRRGITPQADSLLTFLQHVGLMGFSPEQFRASAIMHDLSHLRELDVTSDEPHSINAAMARLEYNLTKGYLRYVAGQRFGFFNPKEELNRLDEMQSDRNDSTGIKHYRTLFDQPIDLPGKKFWRLAIHKIEADSVAAFLHEVQPQNPLYTQLLKELHQPGLSDEHRAKILVNLEKARWRLSDNPWQHKKYIIVNIPAYRLYANNDGVVISMRVGVGADDTKTPLLLGNIHTIDINPQWILPKSIIKHGINLSRGYFERRNFLVRHRATGKIVDVSQVTRDMLLSGEYLVIQRGGEGNSLGRMIFRFDNNYSIYLHDTSTRGFFQNDDRGVSHGCVRVEKPFALAEFILGKGQKTTLEKINYSIHADVSSLGSEGKNRRTEEKRSAEDDEDYIDPADTLRRDMLIGRTEVKPQVPLFIFYLTLYPTAEGRFLSLPDVYGYDRVIWQKLRNYR